MDTNYIIRRGKRASHSSRSNEAFRSNLWKRDAESARDLNHTHLYSHTLPIMAQRGVNDFIYSSKYNDVNIVRKHRKCSTNRM